MAFWKRGKQASAPARDCRISWPHARQGPAPLIHVSEKNKSIPFFALISGESWPSNQWISTP